MGQYRNTYTSPGEYFIYGLPYGVTIGKMFVWGGGGMGGSTNTSNTKCGGGGGGACAFPGDLGTPNFWNYDMSITVGAGGNGVVLDGGNSLIKVMGPGDVSWTTLCEAGGGGGVALNSTDGGALGKVKVGTGFYGGEGGFSGASYSGGGGGGGGTTEDGGSANGSTSGTGGSRDGGDGATGRTSAGTGSAGLTYGGGGAGGYSSLGSATGGNGGNGGAYIELNWPDNVLMNEVSPMV